MHLLRLDKFWLEHAEMLRDLRRIGDRIREEGVGAARRRGPDLLDLRALCAIFSHHDPDIDGARDHRVVKQQRLDRGALQFQVRGVGRNQL